MLKGSAIVWLGEFVQFQLSRKNIFLMLGIIAVVPPLLFWLGGRPDFSMEKAFAGAITGCAASWLAAVAISRYLPSATQRAARLRALEREFEHEIARLRGGLERAERGLAETRESIAKEFLC